LPSQIDETRSEIHANPCPLATRGMRCSSAGGCGTFAGTAGCVAVADIRRKWIDGLLGCWSDGVRQSVGSWLFCSFRFDFARRVLFDERSSALVLEFLQRKRSILQQLVIRHARVRIAYFGQVSRAGFCQQEIQNCVSARLLLQS